MGIIAPSFGEMDERFKSPPWKGGIGATLSRVRIPLSPPNIKAPSRVLLLFCYPANTLFISFSHLIFLF